MDQLVSRSKPIDQADTNYPWPAHKLEQGMVVAYDSPNAQQPELCGRRFGVVMSCTLYNQGGGEGVRLSPILDDKAKMASLFNLLYGISVADVLSKKPAGFIRTDFMETLSPAFANLQPLNPDLSPASDPKDIVILSPEIVKKAVDKFIDIISPTDKKMGESGNWAYGWYGWFNNFPRNVEKSAGICTAIILTPRSLWQVTGAAIVMRSYTNLLRYRPRSDVFVNGPEKLGFFNCQVSALNPDQRGTTRSDDRFLQMSKQCLAEITEKMRGVFDDAVYDRLVEQYPGKVGELPSSPHTGCPVHLRR